MTATCEVREDPPPRKPLPHLSQLQYLKMLGLKALHSALENCDWFLASAAEFAPTLVRASLDPSPLTEESTAPVTSKSLVLESNHPYDHNLDQYTPVRIPGAKRLLISFDEQSATESGCDYVSVCTILSYYAAKTALVLVVARVGCSMAAVHYINFVICVAQVTIYMDSSHTTTAPGGDKLTGGKDGGSSNWPGMKDRAPLTVEGDSCEVYL